MGDRVTLGERVDALLINPDAIEKIDIINNTGEVIHTIPNQDRKKASLEIYAAITTNRGWIGADEARQGLQIYGEELREETKANPEQHPNIALLEDIASVSGARARSNIHRRPEAKPLPFTEAQLRGLTGFHATPFLLYDEQGIIASAEALNSAFSWVPGGFRNYFAVKACPNNQIIRLLHERTGMGADCASETELNMARNLVGLSREEMMFSSNNTPLREFQLAREFGAIINFDDITHIPFYFNNGVDAPKIAFCRFNPGDEKGGNSIIGKPVESKYGMTRPQILEAFKMLKERGVERFGLHTMVASNERNSEYFVETARIMFQLAAFVKVNLGIEVEAINLGGGIGTPYRPEHRAVDLARVSAGIKQEFESRVAEGYLRKDLKLFMECGRAVTGPNGFLVTGVRHITHKYKDFIGLDSCMNNVPRPGIYDAYHHLSVLGKDYLPRTRFYDVTGGLCENNDKFAVDRALPEGIATTDIFVVHNAGAHCYAMGSNYNGQLKCAEFLANFEKGSTRMIRKAETQDNYFATLTV